MSDRPNATAAPTRLRRPLRRLRDMPIWSKLGIIMIIPTLATLVVGVNGLVDHLGTYTNADRARVLANLTRVSGELTHHLQDERAAAVLLLGAAGGEEADERLTIYTEVQRRTDQARDEYERHRAALAELPASFRSLLNDIGGRLSGLPQLRSRIAAGEFGLTEAASTYEELISGLINIRESSAQLSGEATLGDRMRAAAAIARSKEYLCRQRVVGHEVLIRGAYHPHLRTAFIGTQTGRAQAEEQFAAVATAEERAMLERTLDGPEVRQSVLFQAYLDGLEGEDLGEPPWDAQSWDAVLSAHADLLREIEVRLDAQAVAEATALRDQVAGRVLVETALLVVTLTLAILLAWLVARSMARSLRELRQGALAVAQYGLPQAVARLRDPALSTQLSPKQVAEQIFEPLPVRGRDEFGQVAEAFNAVHLEAVRTAAEQAALRSSVSTMFVNLARRSQLLVDRLIAQLDRLERREEDPDRLAELFQLDHLATRMRRNDENLLVLAGADSTRVHRHPAALIDVLRAAQSEVEHYTRIDFGVVDRDIEIAAHAVNDLVHLVAELLDNATNFSPPDAYVTVEARRLGDRVLLCVIDQGLGMSDEQLAEINQRLAKPPVVDVSVSRMMGLVVVSRLAARHGVKVELRRGIQGGTVAEVMLPPTVLAPGSPGGPPALESVLSRPLPYGAPPRSPLALEPADPSTAGVPGAPVSPAPASRLREPFRPVSAAPASAPPVSGAPVSSAPASGPPASDTPLPSRGPGRRPVWSDLTGSSGTNGTAATITAPGAPLPRRQPGATGAGATSGLVPRQRSVDDGPAVPPSGSSTTSGAGPAVPPPAWPLPPGPGAQSPTVDDQPPGEAGPVDETVHTHLSGDRPEHTGQSASAPAASPGGVAPPALDEPPAIRPVVPPADETVELPIFRQVESAWFRPRSTRRPGGTSDPSETAELAAVGADGATTEDATMGKAASGTLPEGQQSAEATEESVAPGWHTAADEGWRAASSLAEVPVDGVTAAGLPKRRPMAQLVPGGVVSSGVPRYRRTPEAVRGLLSAYHRGVQRGRMQHSGDEVARSAQAGKEQGS